MEIFGILSFLKKNRLPNDLESRVSRLKEQETRMTTILTKQVSYSTRQIVLSIELARTWVLYCVNSPLPPVKPLEGAS